MYRLFGLAASGSFKTTATFGTLHSIRKLTTPSTKRRKRDKEKQKTRKKKTTTTKTKKKKKLIFHKCFFVPFINSFGCYVTMIGKTDARLSTKTNGLI